MLGLGLVSLHRQNAILPKFLKGILCCIEEIIHYLVYKNMIFHRLT